MSNATSSLSLNSLQDKTLHERTRNGTKSTARLSCSFVERLLFRLKQFHSELFSQAFSAPAHHHVVIPLEEGARDWSQQVHPALCGLHSPIVARGRNLSIARKLPETLAGQFTKSRSFDERHRLDARQFHIKRQPVRQLALPSVTIDAADVARISLFHEHDILDTLPPRRPAVGVINHLPHRRER